MNTEQRTLEVNGITVPLEDEENLLAVVRKAGIELPTLCYIEGLSVYGGCRQCLVETDKGQILAACSTVPQPGMKIRTHTERVQRIRRMALELTLAHHDSSCTTCVQNGHCKLQELATAYGLDTVRFEQSVNGTPRDLSAAGIVHDPNKCILCGACVRTCAEVQSIAALDFVSRGSRMNVATAFNRGLGAVECVQCGQCTVVCPTGALTVKSETKLAWDALHNPDKVVVAQIAPAVRVAIGEIFGTEPGAPSLGKLVTALRMMGVDYVFDTVFAADLTVMEETSEFLQRLKDGERLPLFTSCCPAWVKFAEHNFPEMLPHLSSCKSPQQMFGSVIKQYYAKQIGRAPEDIFVLSIMPCTAKKYEAARPEFSADGVRDVDLVLTTQEIVQMIQESGFVFAELPEGELDSPYGEVTGAGLIFGATGGVAEAVLRAAHWFATGENISAVDFTEVRGCDGLKTATVDVAGQTVRVAVTHTLARAKEVVQRVREGRVEYDIIEVMACPGGCIGGAGQPPVVSKAKRYQRAAGLYAGDKALPRRRSQDNPAIQALYDAWLGEPNSETAHTYLHTTYTDRSRRAQWAMSGSKS